MKIFVYEASIFPLVGVPQMLYHVLAETGEFLNFPYVLVGSDEDIVLSAVYNKNPMITDNDDVEIVTDTEAHDGMKRAYKAHLEATAPLREKMKKHRAHIAELHGIVANEES